MKAEKKAEKALYSRIAHLADDAGVEETSKLAEAFAKVKWGAQGRTDQVYDNVIRRESPVEKGMGFR
jgi:hypothetical protein